LIFPKKFVLIQGSKGIAYLNPKGIIIYPAKSTVPILEKRVVYINL